MGDDYITVRELLLLLATFVVPFALVGALAQFLILRRAGVRLRTVTILVAAGAVLMIPLTFALIWWVPTIQPLELRFGFGGHLILPAFLGAILLTFLVAVYAWIQPRKPAA